VPEDKPQFDQYDRYRTDITLREALEMFATKESVAATASVVATLSAQVAGIVSRNEHEARWKYEDERYTRIDKRETDIEDKVDDLASRLPPKWLYPLMSIIVPVLLVAVQYLLHTQVPQQVPH
jgi:hypothetical protein